MDCQPSISVVPSYVEVIFHLPRLTIPNFECPQLTELHFPLVRKLAWIYHILKRQIDVGDLLAFAIRAVRPLSGHGHLLMRNLLQKLAADVNLSLIETAH
jgi:hypothetical protein